MIKIAKLPRISNIVHEKYIKHSHTLNHKNLKEATHIHQDLNFNQEWAKHYPGTWLPLNSLCKVKISSTIIIVRNQKKIQRSISMKTHIDLRQEDRMANIKDKKSNTY